MSITIDHVGILTWDVKLFEKFWCGLFGYKQCGESDMPKEMCKFLFGLEEEFLIRRYTHPIMKPDLEIHEFKNRDYQYDFDYCDGWDHFAHRGYNHICLHTGGPGSRRDLLNRLPASVERIIYPNPKGWENIFIKDFEGNNCELRESFE